MSPAAHDPWTLHDLGATAHLRLEGSEAPCRLWCAFCPRSLELRRPDAPTDPARVQATVAAFEHHLAGLRAETLTLVADDILSFPALDQLLGLATARGMTVVLGTPGVGLDDPVKVRSLAAHGAEVSLTWLAHEPETFARISGSRAAQGRLVTALGLLREHGVGVRMQLVVTADNVGELDAMVHELVVGHGFTELTLHLFYPDLRDPPERYLRQFPELGQVRAAFERLAARGLQPAPVLWLGNLPLCQLDLRGLEGLDVRPHLHQAAHNAYDTAGIAACATCHARDRCVRVHPWWAAHRSLLPVDPAVIDANLALASRR